MIISNILIWVSCFFFFLHTNKTKAKDQLKSPKQCCNWWNMADVPEDFDSQVCFRSPAVPTSVVSYGCKLSAQADCDVGVERPPGH